MKIEKFKHLNKNTIKIENQFLEVHVLEDFGAKIASIIYKEKDFQLLFQPSMGKYEKPELGDSFEEYDTSGIDEMLPTIDRSYYPNTDIELFDHGNIWTEKWDYEIEDGALISHIKEPVLGLDFSRRIELDGNKIKLFYSLENKTDKDLFYLWAFHGLFNFGEDTEIELPKGSIVNVMKDKEYDFDIRKLGEYPDQGSYKFYLADEVEEGVAKIIHKKENIEIIYKFDTEINKYLGIWVTKGGFKGEYNLAIEPSSGYYDSLEKAYKNKKISKIERGQRLTWNLELEVNKWR